MKFCKLIASLIILFNILAADVAMEIQNVNSESGTLDIYMTNVEPVAGFQFELYGITLSGISGGSAEQYFNLLIGI